jgi:periplasmic divalent cation tolerance protein
MMAVAAGARIVFVMAANEEEASSIARTRVEERLAACVNVIAPVRSIYRWRGAIEESSECLLLIKTRASHYLKVERRVKQLHSYEVPEIIATALAHGSSDYLNWIVESTAPLAAAPSEPHAPAPTRRSPRTGRRHAG